MEDIPPARNFEEDGKCSVLLWVVVTGGRSTVGKSYQAEPLRWVHFIDINTAVKNNANDEKK